jgi:iron complex outermembrane receptor protein
MKRTWIVAAGVGAMLVARPALPQDGTELPSFSETVTVTAPIVEATRVDEFSSAVTVVGRKQLEEQNAADFADALRNLTGVTLARYGMVGSYGGGDGGAVFLRAQGSGRPGAEVQMQFDGIPRFVGVWTHPLLDTLNPDRAGSLEVFKSPEPVRFGSMAFGAVNLVPYQRGEEGFEASLSIQGGTHGTWKNSVEASGREGAWAYTVAGSYDTSDGHRPRSAGETRDYYGSLSYAFSERWALRAVFDHAEGWAQDPGQEGMALPPVTPRFAVTDDFAVLTLEDRAGASRGFVKVYLDDGDLDWDQWDPKTAKPFNTTTRYRNYGVRAERAMSLWEGNETQAGLHWDNYGGAVVQDGPSTLYTFPSLTFQDTSPFVRLSHRFGGRVPLVPSVGVRWTHSRHFGGHWAYEGGLKAEVGGAEYYLRASSGFNLPGVYAAVLYDQWGRGGEWKDLTPEKIVHAELGALWTLSARWRLTASLYHDRVTDALRFVPPPPPPPMYANLGDYETTGLDVTLAATLGPSAAAFFGASWMDTTPDDVPNAPRTSLNGGFNAAFGPLVRLSMDAQWVDRHYVLNPRYAAAQKAIDAYFLWNAQVSVRLHASGLEAFLAGQNLTDSEYEYRIGYPMPGRTWSAGFRANL